MYNQFQFALLLWLNLVYLEKIALLTFFAFVIERVVEQLVAWVHFSVIHGMNSAMDHHKHIIKKDLLKSIFGFFFMDAYL